MPRKQSFIGRLVSALLVPSSTAQSSNLLEALEGRVHLSVAYQDLGGDTYVKGNLGNKKDAIVVNVIADPDNTPDEPARHTIVVNHNGKIDIFQNTQTNSIDIDTYGGKNEITVNLVGNGWFPGVYVHGGDKADNISITQTGDVRQNYIYVDAGAGDDNVKITQVGFQMPSNGWWYNPLVLLGDGNDTCTINSDAGVQAYGGKKNDLIIVTTPETANYVGNYLVGDEGDDTIISRHVNSYMIGGAGNDVMVGGSAGSSFQDDSGNNTMIGGSFVNTYNIFGGNNRIVGGGWNNTVYVYAAPATINFKGSVSGYNALFTIDGVSLRSVKLTLENVDYVGTFTGGKG